jgi:hypothetical protein
VGRLVRSGPIGRGGLAGIVVFLAIAGLLAGGCGATANPPTEEPEQA